jgi:hypothetical protein
MKDFDRFPHAGVRHFLVFVRDYLASNPNLSFGSSGEGELTIKAPACTAYIRKYKEHSGWRIVLVDRSKVEDEMTTGSIDDLLEILEEAFAGSSTL